MTIEYLRYRFPDGLGDKFEADYKAAIIFLKQSEYCIGCELSRCEEDPDRYILRIEWTSTKDHIEGFRNSPEFKKFLPLIKTHIKHLEEMHHYTPLII